MLLQADKDKEKVASIIAKALQHQGGSNENLPDAAGGVPNISSSTPSSENATLAMHTMPIELSIHFERADKGLGLSIAGMYISIFCILEKEENCLYSKDQNFRILYSRMETSQTIYTYILLFKPNLS